MSILLLFLLWQAQSVKWPQTMMLAFNYEKRIPHIKGSLIQSEINSSDLPRAENKRDELNGLRKYSLHTYTCYMGAGKNTLSSTRMQNPQPLFHVTFPACMIREL